MGVVAAAAAAVVVMVVVGVGGCSLMIWWPIWFDLLNPPPLRPSPIRLSMMSIKCQTGEAITSTGACRALFIPAGRRAIRLKWFVVWLRLLQSAVAGSMRALLALKCRRKKLFAPRTGILNAPWKGRLILRQDKNPPPPPPPQKSARMRLYFKVLLTAIFHVSPLFS